MGLPPAPERAPARRARRTAVWTAIGATTVLGGYGLAQWHLAGQVPEDTWVAGVAVGGLAHPEAVAVLDDALTTVLAAPVALTTGAADASLDPAAAGLGIDAAATLAPVTGFTLDPGRLWSHLRGGDELCPVVTVDRELLATTSAALADELARDPVDGSVTFADAQPVATAASPGSQVDPDAVAAAVEVGWPTAGNPLEVPHEPVEPTITQDATDAAYAQAHRLVAEPILVDVAGRQTELPPRVLAQAAEFLVADRALVAELDGNVLLAAVVERTDGLVTDPVDARFEVTGPRPQIVAGTTGTTIDPAALATAVEAAAHSENRTAIVETTQHHPEVTTASLEELGVEEVVARFSTSLTANRVRTDNIRLGSQRITGTLIRPGETFSLLDALGPITTAAGFGDAPVIVGGQFVPGVGGGLSQLATNVFNAGFFAGFEIVEHRPHSVWIPRYPAGREATIFTGSIDLRLRNNTPYGAVLHAFVEGNELVVQIWSTEHLTVETTQGERRNVVPAVTNHSTRVGCVPRSAGSDGFTITNTRRVYRGTERLLDEAHTWTYRADHGTSCGPAAASDAPE